jgi:hypothetical protein
VALIVGCVVAQRRLLLPLGPWLGPTIALLSAALFTAACIDALRRQMARTGALRAVEDAGSPKANGNGHGGGASATPQSADAVASPSGSAASVECEPLARGAGALGPGAE